VATYTVINGTPAQLANVDGSSTNVDAFCFKDGITLDATHLAALLDGVTFAGKAIAVMNDLAGNAQATQRKRAASLAALYLSS
jgi:hypothetical protein